MGIIDVLNEECVRPRGSDEGTCVQTNYLHGAKSTKVCTPQDEQDQFTIKHYAGDVTYTAHHWLERNTDALPEDLAGVAQAVHSRCSPSYFLRQ